MRGNVVRRAAHREIPPSNFPRHPLFDLDVPRGDDHTHTADAEHSFDPAHPRRSFQVGRHATRQGCIPDLLIWLRSEEGKTESRLPRHFN